MCLSFISYVRMNGYALGASYFIEDMLEEMSDIQTMLDAVVKTQG
ncbi:hypothetical protein [Oceanospirillum beijerinckii]|nr:hypothetical protein [Oceanospirillum beijerinckii]